MTPKTSIEVLNRELHALQQKQIELIEDNGFIKDRNLPRYYDITESIKYLKRSIDSIQRLRDDYINYR